ncbi:MAG TPA: hypothetical protein VFN40_05550 [Gemmatimonadales bacterium]|nr:hypothetical protein [Gemmatimonadales bacterium]
MRQWCRLRFGPAVIAMLAALAGVRGNGGMEPITPAAALRASGDGRSLDLRNGLPRQMIVNAGGQMLRVIEP